MPPLNHTFFLTGHVVLIKHVVQEDPQPKLQVLESFWNRPTARQLLGIVFLAMPTCAKRAWWIMHHVYLFVGMCSVEGTPHCHVQMRTSEVPTCNLRTLYRQVYNGQPTPNQPSFNCKSLAMHGGVPTISWPFQRLNIMFTYFHLFLETLLCLVATNPPRNTLARYLP